jgi:hypothetical protein
MKVLEKGKWKENWSFVFDCKDCESKLEADVSDVRVGEFGGSYAESGDIKYYVSCPECGANAFVPLNKLSVLVKKEADKKKNW